MTATFLTESSRFPTKTDPRAECTLKCLPMNVTITYSCSTTSFAHSLHRQKHIPSIIPVDPWTTYSNGMKDIFYSECGVVNMSGNAALMGKVHKQWHSGVGVGEVLSRQLELHPLCFQFLSQRMCMEAHHWNHQIHKQPGSTQHCPQNSWQWIKALEECWELLISFLLMFLESLW